MANAIPKSASITIAGAGNLLAHTCSTGITGGIQGVRKFKLKTITGTISGAGLVTVRDGGAAGTIMFQMTFAAAAVFHYDNLNIEFQTDCHVVNAAAVNLFINFSGEEY